jgi:two-component system response regulator RegX3
MSRRTWGERTKPIINRLASEATMKARSAITRRRDHACGACPRRRNRGSPGVCVVAAATGPPLPIRGRILEIPTDAWSRTTNRGAWRTLTDAEGLFPPGYHHLVKLRILVVEDEQAIAEPLAESLGREGFDPEVATTLEEARTAYHREPPDLILLDVMLPDGDGRDLAREIRRESDVPIIMLTARGEEIDRVLGLELGADDYVVKPFSVRELTARIRAIMRRGRLGGRRGAIEVGEIRLDPASRTVTKGGRPVELAAREFDLLHLLMSNAGEVVRRERIMDEVWDPHWFGPTKTLDVHISWLRKKLEDDPSNPRYITTIRGVGFRFAGNEDLAMKE